MYGHLWKCKGRFCHCYQTAIELTPSTNSVLRRRVRDLPEVPVCDPVCDSGRTYAVYPSHRVTMQGHFPLSYNKLNLVYINNEILRASPCVPASYNYPPPRNHRQTPR